MYYEKEEGRETDGGVQVDEKLIENLATSLDTIARAHNRQVPSGEKGDNTAFDLKQLSEMLQSYEDKEKALEEHKG